jgi:hypothetical protein
LKRWPETTALRRYGSMLAKLDYLLGGHVETLAGNDCVAERVDDLKSAEVID